MLFLLKNELSNFFSTLIGYVVIVVFLLICGLFIWVMPGQFNIPDAGYATVDSLFMLAPWVFLFLIPAITMRMFAEEQRSGTLDLLMTRPLSSTHIVLAKYFAALILVLVSLMPTLIYYYSVVNLGMEKGNVDSGAFWGSFIGLILLASIYVAIGIFASSLTQNQIIAFIISVVLCFFLFTGLESVSSIPFMHPIQHALVNIGINEHYNSVSRGVLDASDIVYFVIVNILFLSFTYTKLESRNW